MSITSLSLSSADGDCASLIGLPEAAHRLGVRYMTAYRFVRTGRRRAMITNGLWRVDRADSRAFIEWATGFIESAATLDGGCLAFRTATH